MIFFKRVIAVYLCADVSHIDRWLQSCVLCHNHEDHANNWKNTHPPTSVDLPYLIMFSHLFTVAWKLTVFLDTFIINSLKLLSMKEINPSTPQNETEIPTPLSPKRRKKRAVLVYYTISLPGFFSSVFVCFLLTNLWDDSKWHPRTPCQCYSMTNWLITA